MRALLVILPLLLQLGCRGETSPVGSWIDPENPPNVVLIGLDTVRADHLGCYGNEEVRTPHLDAFAREAVLFERCGSTAPWTLPAFASVFTGQLPHRHGAIGGPQGSLLHADAVPLAELLSRAGWRSQGFVAVDYLTQAFNMEQGFLQTRAYVHGKVSGRSELYLSRIFHFLRQPPRDARFFLFAHFFDAHAPYEPPRPFDRMYYEGNESDPADSSLAVIYTPRNRIKADPRARYRWLDGITDLDFPVKQYAADISHLDGQVGAVLDSLRVTGRMDESIVIVLADHGEHLTEHDVYFTHRLPYQETLHVPLLIRLPGGAEGGRRVSEDVSLVDVLPTLLELLGLEPGAPLDGRSLVPLMAGQPGGSQRLLFAEHGGRLENRAKAVWDERYRLVRFHLDGGDWTELYDRIEDPGETRDLSEELPDVRRRLEAALDARFDPAHPLRATLGDSVAGIDPEVDARLKALGYIED